MRPRIDSVVRGCVSAALALALGLGCTEAVAPGPLDELTSLPRALTAQETAVISAANEFSFALFRTVSAAEANKNVFVSPLSASMALGMALNGARGTTFDAMRAALQVNGVSQADINGGYKSLLALLRGLDETTQIEIANSIWHRNTVTFAPEFLAAGQQWFDASVTGLDFTQADASKAIINAWVNERTKGKIPTIVDEIRTEHVMFLINAIYFKGRWRTQFDPAETKAADFTTSTGAIRPAQMMKLSAAALRAGQAPDGASIVDLPYGNAAFTMAVVLPAATTTADAYGASLTAAKWDALTKSLGAAAVNLWMPKFRLEYERTLNDDLTSLGMGIAFTDAANFSGMTVGGAPLAISRVKQKTFVDINEEGTEAAAATSVEIVFTSAPQTIDLRLDRPYLIVIRERLSGTVLFIGKVNTM